jgi:cell filamentation protein
VADTAFPDSIEPPFYPNTTVFVNILGITEAKRLSEKEADFTVIRSIELLQKIPILPQTFDFNHLKAIHQYLFQDLYQWAGKPRGYDVKKGNDIFTPASELPKYQNQVFARSLALYNGPRLSGQVEMAEKLAACYGIINIYHPFPEGNGRTQRIFISSLANELGYSIDWHRASAWEVVETSKQAHIGNYEPLEALMSRIVVEL